MHIDFCELWTPCLSQCALIPLRCSARLRSVVCRSVSRHRQRALLLLPPRQPRPRRCALRSSPRPRPAPPATPRDASDDVAVVHRRHRPLEGGWRRRAPPVALHLAVWLRRGGRVRAVPLLRSTVVAPDFINHGIPETAGGGAGRAGPVRPLDGARGGRGRVATEQRSASAARRPRRRPPHPDRDYEDEAQPGRSLGLLGRSSGNLPRRRPGPHPSGWLTLADAPAGRKASADRATS